MPEEKTPEGKLLDLIRRKGRKPGDAGKAPDSAQSPRNRLLQGLKVLRGMNDPQLNFSLSNLKLFKGPKKAVAVDFDLVNRIIIGVIAVFFIMLILQMVFPYPRKARTVIDAPVVARKRVPAKRIPPGIEPQPFDFEERDIFKPYDARQAAAVKKVAGGKIAGLTLIGILYGDDPQAIIREGEAKRAATRAPRFPHLGPEGPESEDKVVREGEMIGDVKVVEIRRREVILKYRGELYTLSL